MKYVIKEKEVEGIKKKPDRVSRIIISEHTVGAKNIAMGTNVTEVGSRIPAHAHENEEEAMFIISGKGTLILNGGEEEIPIEAGTAIFAPKGVAHEIVNTGNEPMKIIWAYSPPLSAHRK